MSEIEQLKAENAQLKAAFAESKQWAEDLAKQCCEMEDALGFKNDCTGEHGEFIPTMGPWKERVRDLIAKEGELGDVKAACAEMRLVIQSFAEAHDCSAENMIRNALSLDAGKGWLSPEARQRLRDSAEMSECRCAGYGRHACLKCNILAALEEK